MLLASSAMSSFCSEDISEKGRGENRAMIFCNTKKTCEQLEDGLNRARVRCDSIHGDKAEERCGLLVIAFQRSRRIASGL